MVERKKNRSMWSSLRNFKRKIFSKPIVKRFINEKKRMKRSDISKELHNKKKNGSQHMSKPMTRSSTTRRGGGY